MLLPRSHSFVLLLTLFVSVIFAVKDDTFRYQNSITLSYQIVGPSQSAIKPLVTVFYDHLAQKHKLSAWSPPTLESTKSSPEPSSSKLVRILLPDGSSTVTSLDTFKDDSYQKIDLWISPEDGSVFSAAVSPLSPPPLSPEEERYRKKVERAKAKGKPIPSRPPVPNSKKAREEAARQLALYEPIKVDLHVSQDGPAPVLNTRAPPQVDAEGREIAQDPQQEKTIFQKYWWVMLIVVVLTMGGGGGEK